MPTIVVVDDEAIFRKGLRTMITAWDREWEVVGEAKDGHEALDLLEKHKPDVIFTDIRMPKMDGIQLQTIARERFPELLCVVISGFDDFTYARQSMRSGAKDYLMKPIERDELHRVLDTLKDKLQAQKNKQSVPPAMPEDRHVRQQAADYLVAGIARNHLLQNDFDLLDQCGFHFEDPYYACLVIKLDKQSVAKERYERSDPSLFQLYIQQFVQEILDRQAKGFSFLYSDTEVGALVNMANADEAYEGLLLIGESIRNQIKALSNLTISIGVGTPVKGFESVPRSFHEAEIALLYRLIEGGDKVLPYGTSKEDAVTSGMKKWSWEALEEAINRGRVAEVEEQVGLVVSELCRTAQTPEMVHQQICKLLLHYYEVSEDLGLSKDWIGHKDIRSLLNGICSISSPEELIEECKLLLGRLTADIAAANKQHDRDPVAQALRYLERHYQEPIALKEVADKVFLNPAYFSTLFKQKTGSTFIERLTEIRIEEAKKKLASSDSKITDIAEQTGFSNIRHFNRVFKNETGLTPKDYRERA